jgi:hypothetical protein
LLDDRQIGAVVMVLPRADLRDLDHDLGLALDLDRVSFARTLGVEQSGLISRLDTFATKKGKHDRTR